MRREDIISDAEIARVHGRANFGTMTARQVVDDGIGKVVVGYHCGHTQFTILREHGLITKPKAMSYDCNLTKKGKKYYRAILAAAPPVDGWHAVMVAHVMRYRNYASGGGDWVSACLSNVISQHPTHWMPLPQPPITRRRHD